MALLPSYATIGETNALLGDTNPWANATDTEKQQALDIGRMYLDNKYTCVTFVESEPPEAVKDANGYLANCHLEGKLFSTAETSTGSFITEQSVSAGSVSSTTKYSDKRGKASQTTDPCPLATARLAQDNTCVLNVGVTVDLIRA